MKQVVDYLVRFAPATSANIRGATPEELQQLDELTEHELPASYRSFLETMGRETGPLHFERADFSIGTVLRYYTEGMWLPPRQYLFIGQDQDMETMDYYLDFATPDPSEPQVVQFTSAGSFSPDKVSPCFESFPSLLWSAAFRSVRLPLLPHSQRYGPSFQAPLHDRPMEALHGIALRLGFAPLPGNGNWSANYDQEDAAIRAYKRPNPVYGVTLTVAAMTPQKLKHLGAILEDQLGLTAIG